MKLKASTDYGLRIVMYLALQTGVCSSKDISDAVAVPRDYLIQLAQLLRNAGIVEARSGKNGGYSLAKDPSEITLLEVINSVDDASKHESEKRLSVQENESRIMKAMKRAIGLAMSSFDAYLNGLTIAELSDCTQDPCSMTEVISSALIREGRRLSHA